MKHEILVGDVLAGLRAMPDASVQCVVTSPPYSRAVEAGGEAWGLRDYGVEGQIGLEPTPEEYVERMVGVFREVRRVLRDDGVIWVNLGDSYTSGNRVGNGTREGYLQATNRGAGGTCDAPRYPTPPGLKPKDLVGIPWRVAFALQADGWTLRSDVIWNKPNQIPESVTDRPTKSHEYVFLLAKQARYFYDADAVREVAAYPNDDRGVRSDSRRSVPGANCINPGYGKTSTHRNRRTVWEIPTQPFSADLETVRFVREEWHVVSDGMTHIVSPNCPVHGGLVGLLTTVICDGRAADLMTHIEHNDAHLAQELLNGYVPTDSTLVQDYGLDNLGLLLAGCVRSATSHNSQTHKTAPDRLTNPPYTLSERTSCHTDDKQALRDFFEQQKNILSNSTLPDEMDARSLDQIPFRTTGILSLKHSNRCLCAFYKKVTKKTAHFATFPEALVEPCIKAGTSERGACPKCGAPWRRMVEKGGGTTGASWHDHSNDLERGQVGPSSSAPRDYYRRDIGWQPSCTCGTEETVPCVVLDPFGGSGTVAKVARDLGRSSVMIELNPAYVGIMKKRLRVGEQLDTGVCEYAVREVGA